MSADITAIILTKNEEVNIGDCIESIKKVVKRIVVIDSYSTDKTIEIAKKYGAEVYQHSFENYAKQYNYGVEVSMDEITQKPYDGCWAEIILHSDEPGVFKELWISDEIAENVVERDLWIEEGTPVGGFEAANEAIGTLVLKFESQERIEEVLGNQSKYVKVKLM